MKKTIAIGVACLVVIVAVMVGAGFRVGRDGSGRPRFVYRASYSALEADRARQHQQSGSTDVVSPIAPPVAAPPAPAQVTSQTAPAEATTPPGFWPDFRGPYRDGRYTETPIRTTWPSAGLPRLWKQPIGGGYASFVVANGRAFTIEQRRNQEVVTAYAVDTGRELWARGWNAEFRESLGGDGPRATPTYHDGRIYALGALGELQVLDAAAGTLVWRRNILTENNAPNVTWGMSASPLVIDEKVIVLPGGPQGRSVAAYNKTTGAPIWKTQDDPQAYTSPMMVTLAGTRQILVVSGRRAMGLAIEDGRLLWEYPWVTDMDISVAQPLVIGGSGLDNRVFLSAGYGHGAAVFEVKRAGERLEARTVWENQRMNNKFSSSVLRDGFIYGLDESILACVDAATGEMKWKGGRYGYGQILLAGDHVIVLTEEGELVLVKAAPERHQELARFAAITGKTWNYPVIAGGRLLVRNTEEMAAFDILPR